jgi:hypothetical protein
MTIDEKAALAAKAVSTGAGAWALLGISPWAWVAAFIGAVASYYFEPEHTPGGALKVLFGVFAMGFAAALVAAVLPFLPLGIGAVANQVSLEVRAGLMGLTIRFLFETGRRLGRSWRAGATTK